MDLRKRPKQQRNSHPSKSNYDPFGSLQTARFGEVDLSNDTAIALQHLYETSPSLQAAKTIIMGQLLGSGIVVKRHGRDVDLKQGFSRHLNRVWIPFARTMIERFLITGFCPVVLDEEDEEPFAALKKARDAATHTNQKHGATLIKDVDFSNQQTHDPNLGRGANDTTKRARQIKSGNLIPVVPDIHSLQVSFAYGGVSKYKRIYQARHSQAAITGGR